MKPTSSAVFFDNENKFAKAIKVSRPLGIPGLKASARKANCVHTHDASTNAAAPNAASTSGIV
jgi:hypothetical protein